MGQFITKASPSEDWYCVWSTVVDAPVEYGTKAELISRRHIEDLSPERFERADRTGTSAKDCDWYGWDDHVWMVRECGLPEARDLLRADLKRFCMALDNNDVDAMMEMTFPIDAPEME
jgi:hypothetical protein